MSIDISDNNKQGELFLDRYILRDKAPSIQYSVFTEDRIIFKFRKGLADIHNKVPTTEKTTFNAYSVTKTFTALAIMQLAELGKIHLEKPASDYLPDFPYSGNITVKQLLTHTAGIPNPLPLSWIHLPEEHNEFDRTIFFKGVFSKYSTVRSQPNEKFSYSNLGYVLLGQLIESITGKSYEEYITEEIIRRLNLGQEELGFRVTSPENHSKGYQKKFSIINGILGFMISKPKFMEKADGKWKSFRQNYVNGPSYGGLIGTSNAFMKYIQELLKHDCSLISDSYKKLLFTENQTVSGKSTGMCLSWFKGVLNGNQYFAHAGGGGGYYCEIRIYPEMNLGSVIMLNRTGVSDERFLNKIDRFFIGN